MPPAAFVVDPADVVHLVDRFGLPYCGSSTPWRYSRALDYYRDICPGCELCFEVAKHLALSESPPGEATPEGPSG